ncbi:hypothetical protein C8T65DRAFT_832410 [Cerioporus squamosus]|nr:hypothetical protein C8T65DRAFT_832410 [Cerioporus squamosus]
MIQPNSNMYAIERPSEYNHRPSQKWSQYTSASTDGHPRTQGVPLGRTASLTTPESTAPLNPDVVHIKKRTTIGNKVIGIAEALAGRVVKNQGMIERGQVRKGV